MKPKHKAEELVDKMLSEQSYTEDLYDAKQCALIAVDEIIELAYWEYMESMGEKEEKYWQQVKQEIINI
jgi:hypothetical protein